jgi:hypothetical protein
MVEEERNFQVCDICSKDLRDEPLHYVLLIENFKSTTGVHYLEGGVVCNKCMFEKFAYCIRCDAYYEKRYVSSDSKCIWCRHQEDGISTEKLTYTNLQEVTNENHD